MLFKTIVIVVVAAIIVPTYIWVICSLLNTSRELERWARWQLKFWMGVNDTSEVVKGTKHEERQD